MISRYGYGEARRETDVDGNGEDAMLNGWVWWMSGQLWETGRGQELYVVIQIVIETKESDRMWSAK
jgi:hypothetical protein